MNDESLLLNTNALPGVLQTVDTNVRVFRCLQHKTMCLDREKYIEAYTTEDIILNKTWE